MKQWEAMRPLTYDQLIKYYLKADGLIENGEEINPTLFKKCEEGEDGFMAEDGMGFKRITSEDGSVEEVMFKADKRHGLSRVITKIKDEEGTIVKI